MYHLGRLASKLERRFDQFDSDFKKLGAAGVPLATYNLYQAEELLSALWQAWCRFSREVVLQSCLGCVTSNGANVAGTYAGWQEVSFVASKQQKGAAPAVIGQNSVLRKEPTWGHIDKLIDVITALAPANASTLMSAFGSVPEVDHVRLIRNCAAHRNHETIAEVFGLRSQYKAFQIRSPLDALFWVDPSSSQLLLSARVDDMRIAARNATL